MFELGVRDALEKFASMDDTVHRVVDAALKAHLSEGKSPGQDDELETLLPDDGVLEAVITVVEENFGIHLPTNTVFALFAEGTVKNLEKAVIKQLVSKSGDKTAAYDHGAYMRNRAQHQQRSRQYRMRNLHQIRRKSRIYRKQVDRGARRKRKRMGTAAGGYSFIRQ